MPNTETPTNPVQVGWMWRNVGILGMLVLALLLGAAWWWRSQGIAAQVEAIGGEFYVDEPNSWSRVENWIVGQPGYRSHVVALMHSEVEDEWLREHRAQLASLSDLCLEFAHTRISNEGLQHLRGLDNISSLSLVATQVTDGGLEHVATMSGLQMLSLSGTQVTSAGLEHLSSLPRLQRLQIDASQATESGIASLRTCRQLTGLIVSDANDESLSHLSGWSQLEYLTLTGSEVTDDSIPVMASLDGLTNLNLLDTSVSDAGLAELQQALPGCEIVRSETPPPPTR